jgi:hypothetical protein
MFSGLVSIREVYSYRAVSLAHQSVSLVQTFEGLLFDELEKRM